MTSEANPGGEMGRDDLDAIFQGIVANLGAPPEEDLKVGGFVLPTLSVEAIETDAKEEAMNSLEERLVYLGADATDGMVRFPQAYHAGIPKQEDGREGHADALILFPRDMKYPLYRIMVSEAYDQEDEFNAFPGQRLIKSHDFSFLPGRNMIQCTAGYGFTDRDSGDGRLEDAFRFMQEGDDRVYIISQRARPVLPSVSKETTSHVGLDKLAELNELLGQLQSGAFLHRGRISNQC